MSRSYKKASFSDYSRTATKSKKRRASKAVRRYMYNINNGCNYKKIYNSYNIFDNKHLYTGKDIYMLNFKRK